MTDLTPANVKTRVAVAKAKLKQEFFEISERGWDSYGKEANSVVPEFAAQTARANDEKRDKEAFKKAGLVFSLGLLSVVLGFAMPDAVDQYVKFFGAAAMALGGFFLHLLASKEPPRRYPLFVAPQVKFAYGALLESFRELKLHGADQELLAKAEASVRIAERLLLEAAGKRERGQSQSSCAQEILAIAAELRLMGELVKEKATICEDLGELNDKSSLAPALEELYANNEFLRTVLTSLETPKLS